MHIVCTLYDRDIIVVKTRALFSMKCPTNNHYKWRQYLNRLAGRYILSDQCLFTTLIAIGWGYLYGISLLSLLSLLSLFGVVYPRMTNYLRLGKYRTLTDVHCYYSSHYCVVTTSQQSNISIKYDTLICGWSISDPALATKYEMTIVT